MRSLTCGLLAALLVVSCGGGGGSAGPAQAPSPAVPPAQDSFYLPFFTGDGRLQLINPATPTAAPSTLDSGLDVQQAERFARGTYQASGPVVLSDAHFSDLVYIKQGHVYRMGLGGLPAVQQISAIDNACQLLPLFADYKNFDHSLLRVVVADPGQTCSSSSFSTRVVIGLAAGTSDPGVTVGRVVALARDYNADGSLAGEVVNESGTIRFYDANFANPQNIAANVADVSETFSPGRDGAYLKFAASGASAEQLYWLDYATRHLTSLYTYNSGVGYDELFENAVADDSALYFADGRQILKLPHGAAAPSVIYTAPAGTAFDLVTASHGSLVLRSTRGSGDHRLDVLPKNGGATVNLVADTTSDFIDVYLTAGPRIYYRLQKTDLSDVTAVSVQEDGSAAVTYAHADWGGSTGVPDLFVANVDVEQQTQSLLLGESDGAGHVLVSVVDPASGAKLRRLGSIDGVTDSYGFNYGRYLLATVTIDRGSGSQDTDVYLGDTQTADSMHGVATQAGSSDAAVF